MKIENRISLEIDGRWKTKDGTGRFAYHKTYEQAWAWARAIELEKEGHSQETAVAQARREVFEYGKTLMKNYVPK